MHCKHASGGPPDAPPNTTYTYTHLTARSRRATMGTLERAWPRGAGAHCQQCNADIRSGARGARSRLRTCRHRRPPHEGCAAPACAPRSSSLFVGNWVGRGIHQLHTRSMSWGCMCEARWHDGRAYNAVRGGFTFVEMSAAPLFLIGHGFKLSGWRSGGVRSCFVRQGKAISGAHVVELKLRQHSHAP